MEVELRLRHIPYEAQRPVLILYKDYIIAADRADLLVWTENHSAFFLVELKAVKGSIIKRNKEGQEVVDESVKRQAEVYIRYLRENEKLP